MKKPKLHTQEWRDFQPFPDPEGTLQSFKRALKRAEDRVKQKRRKMAMVVDKTAALRNTTASN
jgi:hypothetical protein